jgi:hypothetical protein
MSNILNYNDNDDNNDSNGHNFIGTGILSITEDILSSSSLIDMKKYFQNSQKYAHVVSPSLPPITLQYPDPYARNTDPATYTTRIGGIHFIYTSLFMCKYICVQYIHIYIYIYIFIYTFTLQYPDSYAQNADPASYSTKTGMYSSLCLYI